MRILLAASLFFVMSVSVYPSPSKNPGRADLAVVLAVPLVNETGQEHYDWLSGSIPDAIINAMKDRFLFTPMTQKEAGERLPDRRGYKGLAFKQLLTQREARELCSELGVDILIFGNYLHNESDATIIVNTNIFHRSSESVTGRIDMVIPVTSEMFTIIDAVAVQAVAHIEEVARHDAARLAARESEESPQDKERITLRRSDLPVAKPRYFSIGAGMAAPAGYFDKFLAYGPGISLGFMNSYASSRHFGISVDLVYLDRADSSGKIDVNLIEYMIFLPATATVGLNLRATPRITLQPFIGAGISVEVIKTLDDIDEGDDTGEIPDADKWNYYIDPCLTLGIRAPAAVGGFLVSPFVKSFFYHGENAVRKDRTGVVVLIGVELLF